MFIQLIPRQLAHHSLTWMMSIWTQAIKLTVCCLLICKITLCQKLDDNIAYVVSHETPTDSVTSNKVVDKVISLENIGVYLAKSIIIPNYNCIV